MFSRRVHGVVVGVLAGILCLWLAGAASAEAAKPQPTPVAVTPSAAAPAAKPAAVAQTEPASLAPLQNRQVTGPAFPANVPMPLSVGVAMYLNGISKVNDKAGTFEAFVDLQLRWRDPSLKFDAKANGTDRQEYGIDTASAKLATMWTPEVMFDNLVDHTAVSEPGLFIYADGSVIYRQRLRTEFETKFKVAAFPFDRQDLPIQLLSMKYSVNQIALIQEQVDVNASGMKEGLKTSGWDVKRVEFRASRVRAWNGEFVPQMEARILLNRQPVSHLIGILTPYLLVLLVPLVFTLYSKEGVAPRLTSWSGSIFAMIALNFTLSLRYPNLDSDGLVSQFLSAGFGFQSLMVILTVTVFNPAVASRLANTYVITELQSVLRWGLPVGFLSFLLSRTLLTALIW